MACDRAEPPAIEALRQLQRLPAPRWLRTQSRRQRGAAGALAGVERGRTGGLCAPLPRSRGGAGQTIRLTAGLAPQDGLLFG